KTMPKSSKISVNHKVARGLKQSLLFGGNGKKSKRDHEHRYQQLLPSDDRFCVTDQELVAGTGEKQPLIETTITTSGLTGSSSYYEDVERAGSKSATRVFYPPLNFDESGFATGS